MISATKTVEVQAGANINTSNKPETTKCYSILCMKLYMATLLALAYQNQICGELD